MEASKRLNGSKVSASKLGLELNPAPSGIFWASLEENDLIYTGRFF